MSTIFVSYSHLDRKWCDPAAPYPLIPWLETALRRDGATLWYDRCDETGVLPGAEFEAAILNAIDASEFALLLVSEAFFASDFIQDVELPRILQRAEDNGLVVIPILLEPCDWQSFAYVASRQMLPGEPTPLINYTGSDREWVNARDQVLSGIRRRLRERARLTPAKPQISPPLPQKTTTPTPEPSPALAAPSHRRWLPIAAVALVALAVVAGAGRGLSRWWGSNRPEPSVPAAPSTAVSALPTRAPTATAPVPMFKPEATLAVLAPPLTEPTATEAVMTSTPLVLEKTVIVVVTSTSPPPTSTRPATATALRRPTTSPAKAAATASPRSQPTRATALAAPGSVGPPDGASASGRVRFEWSWSGPALEPNQAFEVRLWRENQPEHYGAAAPVTDTAVDIDVSGSYAVQQAGTGSYFWTVALVQQDPYVRLGPEAPPRVLLVTSTGGGPEATPPW